MKTIKANDPLQPGYQYPLAAREGELEFSPDLTPKQMLDLGVFGAHYFEGYGSEFPTDWFSDARVSVVHDFHQNYFNVDASQTREEWEKKAGSTRKTQEDGFSGTVDTTSADEYQRKTSGKLSAGKR